MDGFPYLNICGRDLQVEWRKTRKWGARANQIVCGKTGQNGYVPYITSGSASVGCRWDSRGGLNLRLDFVSGVEPLFEELHPPQATKPRALCFPLHATLFFSIRDAASIPALSCLNLSASLRGPCHQHTTSAWCHLSRVRAFVSTVIVLC